MKVIVVKTNIVIANTYLVILYVLLQVTIAADDHYLKSYSLERLKCQK